VHDEISIKPLQDAPSRLGREIEKCELVDLGDGVIGKGSGAETPLFRRPAMTPAENLLL
jgi:hypothetical protein